MPTVTCNACNAAFDDEEHKRLHYRSEWHRYNLKRKVAGVPGVTEALFLVRLAALAEGSNSTSTPRLYSCALCGKEYRSSKVHAQHLNSRSHLTRASQEPNGSTAGITIVKPLPERVPRKGPSAVEEDEDEVEEWVEVDPSELESISDMQVDEHASESDDDMDELEELDPSICFMCDLKHDTIENCMVHMHKKHGFFIPDSEYLKDHNGLLTYVGLKVKREFMCLYCNGRCQPFISLEAVRKHMDAKGHCKLRYGDGGDDEDADLEDFYDYSSSYVDVEGKELVAADDMDSNIELGSGGSELVITNKSEKGTRVRTLGSREFIRSTGSLFYATLNALSYFYMVCSWGGYTFIINLIPMHVLLCIVTGRYSSRLYIAYAPLIVLGTLLAALVPVVGFNAVMTSEHFASFLVFIILHVVAFVYYIKGLLTPRLFKVAMTFVITVGLAVCFAVVAILVALVASSPTKGWSGRSLSLLDPTYASKYIPIIASVSEHQPPTWPSYFMDINVLAFLIPAGIISCFLPLSDASSFLVLYLVTSVYFSGVMVRLMLVFAPAAFILSGIALSEAFSVLTRSMKFQRPRSDDGPPTAGDSTPRNSNTAATTTNSMKNENRTTEKSETVSKERPSKKNRKREKELVGSSPIKPEKEEKLSVLPCEVSAMGILSLIILCGLYVVHCVWAAAEAYSAPSIVLTSHSHDGLHVFDDFREAYAWLRHNTDVDDKVASWWDYGYQTTAMANRTVIVDNNTWNNTHIATVGTAMSSPEKAAWEIFNSLDVKYVLVVFGGLVGYPSDDINKFLWMVRIGGGVFPHIKEQDYLRDGNYRVDAHGTPTMLNCLMYKLCYYRFVETDGKGFDRVRRYEIGKKHFKLTHFEEVFTTHHWMVRIYKLKPEKNRVRGKSKLKSSSNTSSMRKAGGKNPWQ